MINRRRFIQASALLIAGASTLALTGCGSPKTPEDVACAFVRALYRGDAAEATKFFHVPADARDAEVKIADSTFWFIFALVIVLLAVFPHIAFFFSNIFGIESP